jgi:hypothetical protein
MTTSPSLRALGLAITTLALLLPVSAEAGFRFRETRWIPQGDVAADGYELHLASDGMPWAVVDIGFVATDADGIASFDLPLNNDRDYDIAVSAYVWEDGQKLSSPLSNVLAVAAIVDEEPPPPPPAPECEVHADCSDGDVCTGYELCVDGTCQDGPDILCSDPGPCQQAYCDPQRGCIIEADPVCAPDPDPDPDPEPDPEPDPDPVGPVADALDVSVDLDGVGEQIGTAGATTFGTDGRFTISLWFKPQGLTEKMKLLDWFASGNEPNRSRVEVIIQSRKQDPVRIITRDDDGDWLQVDDFAGRISLNEWTHLAFTHSADGHELDVYFDGQLATPTADRASLYGAMADRARELVLGVGNTHLDLPFDGRMGHVAIWGRRLSAAELAEVHARGHEIDLREASGAYQPTGLLHYWRLGEDLDWIGADWVSDAPVHLEQNPGVDASDVVDDAP